MTINFNPYVKLGVPEDASLQVIQEEFQKLQKRFHPEVNSNPGAHNQYEGIVEAYNLLTDSMKRSAFDRQYRTLKQQKHYGFQLQVLPSRRSIASLNDKQVVYLLARLVPDKRVQGLIESKTKTHLNLTLVLDRSNSMKAERLDQVKFATNQIIDNLSENDYISVVTFNDRADTVISSTRVADKPSLKAKVTLMKAKGGTQMYQGLSAGFEQNQRNFSDDRVNHILLLTDGHTYGDQDKCLELATYASMKNTGISAMGLGTDWNDELLDQIASSTGGSSEYIQSARAVVKFLNDRVRTLAKSFAENIVLSVAPSSNAHLELAFKLQPNAQALTIDNGLIQLGGLQTDRPIIVLLQIQIEPDIPVGYQSIARLITSGTVLPNAQKYVQSIVDFSIGVTQDSKAETPPKPILEALSKLSLYNLQENARKALDAGDSEEATRRLQFLSTRLLEMGEVDLAEQAHTQMFSEEGKKGVKYGTRALMNSTIALEDIDMSDFSVDESDFMFEDV